MSFEHCQSCLPPTRYPGCHSECPHYQADIAKYNEAKGKEWRQSAVFSYLGSGLRKSCD